MHMPQHTFRGQKHCNGLFPSCGFWDLTQIISCCEVPSLKPSFLPTFPPKIYLFYFMYFAFMLHLCKACVCISHEFRRLESPETRVIGRHTHTLTRTNKLSLWHLVKWLLTSAALLASVWTDTPCSQTSCHFLTRLGHNHGVGGKQSSAIHSCFKTDS